MSQTIPPIAESTQQGPSLVGSFCDPKVLITALFFTALIPLGIGLASYNGYILDDLPINTCLYFMAGGLAGISVVVSYVSYKIGEHFAEKRLRAPQEFEVQSTQF